MESELGRHNPLDQRGPARNGPSPHHFILSEVELRNAGAREGGSRQQGKPMPGIGNLGERKGFIVRHYLKWLAGESKFQ